MWHEITRDNMYALVREIGYIRKDQLLRFFSDAASEENLNAWLKYYIVNHSFVIDKTKTIIAFHAAKAPVKAQLDARLKALWVPVSFQSDELRDLFTLSYPSQFGFITEDEDCYDVSYIRRLDVAQVLSQRWKDAIPDGEIDHVNHIALIDPDKEESIGSHLHKYGFSNYCILDPETNHPHMRFCEDKKPEEDPGSRASIDDDAVVNELDIFDLDDDDDPIWND